MLLDTAYKAVNSFAEKQYIAFLLRRKGAYILRQMHISTEVKNKVVILS